MSCCMKMTAQQICVKRCNDADTSSRAKDHPPTITFERPLVFPSGTEQGDKIKEKRWDDGNLNSTREASSTRASFMTFWKQRHERQKGSNIHAHTQVMTHPKFETASFIP